MAKEKILITGAGGQLGSELQVACKSYPQFGFVFVDKEEMPLDAPEKIPAVIEDIHPAWCISCGAYTAVDKAETEKDLAFTINGDAVGAISHACKKIGARLIHISTDYVFPGDSPTPLKENDPTGPINVYGASKLKGEQLALKNNPETAVIRTAWVYSEFGNNFVQTMIRLMKEKPSINVINDQIGSPTYAADLAQAILHIVTAPRWVPGIYHYSNEGMISWYEFALAIRELTNSSCAVNPISTEQYPTPAKRPHYSLLDKTLIKKTYGIEVPDWHKGLVTCIGRL
ncbi:MAG TPA: dTDP-4-dehydrorhamnose reductase, partial [Puia sp.]|nr:dTDP-4-dehydrorhamnose reductase [Puia sp.]